MHRLYAAAAAAVLALSLTACGQKETLTTLDVGGNSEVEEVFSLARALDLGAGFLSGLDYESAILQYTEILQHDPENKAAYAGLYAAYAAQEYAGVLEVSAITYEVDPELDEYPPHYEVELYTAFGEYEYMVDAYTGEILSGPANILENASGSTPATPSGGSFGGAGIGIQGAKAAALAAAGLAESQVTALTVKGDYDDGRLEYEVNFWYNSTEYEYDIDGTTGAVLKQEQEAHASAPSGSIISPEAARDAALAHAGLSLGDVYELEVEAELDEWIPCYQVEFKAGGMEYEYEINASPGQIGAVERDWYCGKMRGAR